MKEGLNNIFLGLNNIFLFYLGLNNIFLGLNNIFLNICLYIFTRNKYKWIYYWDGHKFITNTTDCSNYLSSLEELYGTTSQYNVPLEER